MQWQGCGSVWWFNQHGAWEHQHNVSTLTSSSTQTGQVSTASDSLCSRLYTNMNAMDQPMYFGKTPNMHASDSVARFAYTCVLVEQQANIKVP